MKTCSSALRALLMACAVLAAAPAAVPAAPTIAELRVEAEGRALSPGVSYVNDTARINTRPSQCEGSGDPYTLAGPTAMGILDYARRDNARLSPLFVSDRFEFALIVCRIGDSGAFSPSQAWLYKVNHVSPEVGADQYRLRHGDEVLWFFADFANGKNTGDELVLRTPARVRPDEPFTVKAVAFDFAGNRKPAGGAALGGDADAVTGPDGSATVQADREGSLTLRAKRGSDVPSAPVRVCVAQKLSTCPEALGLEIVGTDGPDVIGDTGGADAIRAGGGSDRVDVRGGGDDAVDCGAGGLDRVRADRGDRIDRDCEQRIIG